MPKIFRKSKMLARIEHNGLSHMIDEATIKIMDSIDGKICQPNLWRQTVYGEVNAWYCTNDAGEQIPINPDDCEDID